VEYFVLSYRLSLEERYLIWTSDDEDSKKDCFATDEDGMVPSFANIASLERYATQRNLILSPASPHLHDFDVIVSWLSTHRNLPKCEELLNAWNAFSDVSNSVKRETSFAKLNFTNKPIYDKLFWGNNLPAVTPKSEQFDPIWNKQELESLINIFTSGIELFLSSIKHIAPSQTK
jgi:hypothetical protein